MATKARPREVVLAALIAAAAACVPVTVNISFPQEKLDSAAKQIEDITAQTGPQAGHAATPPATAPTTAATTGSAPVTTPQQPPVNTQGRTVDVTPRIDTRSPEVVRATQSRRERRPALREWKERGCLGETNQGLLEARTGEGCTAEALELMRAENADRVVIYEAFMKENNIPASDTERVRSAFAKARQERARPGDWVQLADGHWVKKE
jgi:uncharacterized protein YdbL (DUF1318 family)